MKNVVKAIAGFIIMLTPYLTSAQEDTKTNTTVTTTSSTTTAIQDDNSGITKDFPVFYLGFRFMPTFTYLDYREMDGATIEATAVVGYGYGGFMGFNLSNNIALQAEVIYSQLAQKFKMQERSYNVKLDYINIPLLLRINTGVMNPVNLNFVIGPQLGLNVGSSVDSEDNGSTTTVVTSIAVKKGDIGLAYGAGLDFRLGGNTTLGLGFRGVYGLVDISDRSNTQETNEYYVLDKAHVKTYAGYIGLAFGF